MLTVSRMQTNRRRTRVHGNDEHDFGWKDMSSVVREYTAHRKESLQGWPSVPRRKSRGSKELLPQSRSSRRGSLGCLVLHDWSGHKMGKLRRSALQRQVCCCLDYITSITLGFYVEMSGNVFFIPIPIPDHRFSLVLLPFPSNSHQLFPFLPAPIPVLLVVSHQDNNWPVNSTMHGTVLL